MPKTTEDLWRAGSRLCAHCGGVTTGMQGGWKRCPVPSCRAAVHTICMNAHGAQEHPNDRRFK